MHAEAIGAARSSNVAIRPALARDVPFLVALEDASFDTDRLTRRNFRWILRKGNAALLVAEAGGELAGYILVLFHAGTSLARLYSIAVEAGFQRTGIARLLLDHGEELARLRDCVYMRLEVRPDNVRAIRFYERRGYRKFDVWPDYYEDHMEALRYEKRIQFPTGAFDRAIPFYRQTTDFTCGPAALIMAMSVHDSDLDPDPRLEFRLWREATTIFMTSGHGGCGPHGLALAAWRRGFGVEMYVSEQGVLFIDSVRDEKKKAVMCQVQADFADQIADTGIIVLREPLAPDWIEQRIHGGGVPLMLISSYRINREKSPHWVVVTGIDDRFMYIHDPDVDEDLDKTETDCVNVPIRRRDFEKMAQYGKSGLKAAVVVFPRRSD